MPRYPTPSRRKSATQRYAGAPPHGDASRNNGPHDDVEEDTIVTQSLMVDDLLEMGDPPPTQVTEVLSVNDLLDVRNAEPAPQPAVVVDHGQPEPTRTEQLDVGDLLDIRNVGQKTPWGGLTDAEDEPSETAQLAVADLIEVRTVHLANANAQSARSTATEQPGQHYGGKGQAVPRAAAQPQPSTTLRSPGTGAPTQARPHGHGGLPSEPSGTIPLQLGTPRPRSIQTQLPHEVASRDVRAVQARASIPAGVGKSTRGRRAARREADKPTRPMPREAKKVAPVSSWVVAIAALTLVGAWVRVDPRAPQRAQAAYGQLLQWRDAGRRSAPARAARATLRSWRASVEQHPSIRPLASQATRVWEKGRSLIGAAPTPAARPRPVVMAAAVPRPPQVPGPMSVAGPAQSLPDVDLPSVWHQRSACMPPLQATPLDTGAPLPMSLAVPVQSLFDPELPLQWNMSAACTPAAAPTDT